MVVATTTATMAMIGDAKESKRFCMRTLNFCMNTIIDDQISSGYIFVPMIAEIYAAVQPCVFTHSFISIPGALVVVYSVRGMIPSIRPPVTD